MSIIKNNNIFEKTSFLGNNSSEFIEELYAQYITNPQGLTEEWKEFFKGLKDFASNTLPENLIVSLRSLRFKR